MPRKPRIETAGGVWHITARGTARTPIFLHPNDYQLFLYLFARIATEFQWRVFVFTLMTNHLHLGLQTPIPNMGLGMQRILGRFAAGFNQRYGRTGHLFQGRFDSIPIESESHLLEACRYVLLNPVRAGIVRDFRDYPWNSYSLLTSEHPPAWFDPAPLLSYFHPTNVEEARELMLRFVDEGVQTPKPQFLCAR